MEPEYCCNAFKALVLERDISIDCYGVVKEIAGYEYEDYDIGDPLFNKFKYCPYCGQPIKDNKEYREWQLEQDRIYEERNRLAQLEQFKEEHKGYEDHVYKPSAPFFGQEHRTGRIVGPYYSKKECIYCYHIEDP